MKREGTHLYKAEIPSNLRYEGEELVKMFLRPSEYEVVEIEPVKETEKKKVNRDEKNKFKKKLYLKLSEYTGKTLPWGIITGVRPVKLVAEIFKKLQTEEKVRKTLLEDYLISEEKVNLVLEIHFHQERLVGEPSENSVSVYIGIPFCPTRCRYCSFTSNQSPESEIVRYLEALKLEIDFAGRKLKEKNLKIESLYIGGGTPTTLNSGQLEDLINFIEKHLDLVDCKEFTVEAGRPDTITIDKLRVLRNHNIDRISINPQTMKDSTLELIGRAHSAAQINEAFLKAKSAGINIINGDLIAGLPEENLEDFRNSLMSLIDLGAKNITVHTLAIKRASIMIDDDPEYHYKQGELVGRMLRLAEEILRYNGYIPYYMYRQKHMTGSFENVGWCKEETVGIYNIRIMAENQRILALGAGGISKAYFPEENRVERVPNVSNYQVYIERLDQMLNRKENDFFKEVDIKC